jgi:hypothetical protein
MKTIHKIVLKGGLVAGIGALLPKGSTSKATTVVFSNEVHSTFTDVSSRTSLYDHVYFSMTCSVKCILNLVFVFLHFPPCFHVPSLHYFMPFRNILVIFSRSYITNVTITSLSLTHSPFRYYTYSLSGIYL